MTETESYVPLDIILAPPYSLNNYIEPVFRGIKCGLFRDACNFLVDRESLQVREGLTRFSETALTASTAVTALYRTTYSTGFSQKYAVVGTAIKYYNGTSWASATLPSTITLASDVVGEFRDLKDKTYFTNHSNPVLMIRNSTSEATAPTITEAGLPTPNMKKDIQLCDTLADWTASPAANKEFDQSMGRYVQGEGGIRFWHTTSGSSCTITAALSNLNFNLFEDGSTAAGDEDYIAFTAFRLMKNAISTFKVEFSYGDATFTNSFYCCVYDDTDLKADSWNYFSPKQRSMSAVWANDSHDYKLFDIKLRKKWFGKTGTPYWTDIRAIRFTVKADTMASSTNQASVTVDNVRLLKTPPVAGPYEIQVAEFERQEAWSGTGISWVDYWASKGVSCLKIPSGRTASWTTTKNLSQYADDVAVDESDVIQIDVGGTGSIASTIVVRIYTSTAYRTWTFGILSILQGGGVTRQQQLSGLAKTYGTISWANVTKIEIYNAGVTTVYVDNLRIGPAKPRKWIDPLKAADVIALTEASEWLTPWLKDHPIAAKVLGYGAEFYVNFRYRTSGEGAMTYPFYERSSYGKGIPCLRLQSAASATFSVLIKRLVNLDLSQYEYWVTKDSFSALTIQNWENGSWGWLQKVEQSIRDTDEFQIWLSSPNWAAIREIKFKFYHNSSLSPTLAPVLDPEKYWEYTFDYSQIQEKLYKIQAIKGLYKTANQYLGKNAKYIDSTSKKEYVKTYLQEIGGLTDEELEQIVYLGQEQGDKWHSCLLRWKWKDMMWHPPEGDPNEPNRQYCAGYEIAVTAGGADADVCFDNWIIRSKGALTGQYYYRVVLEDDEGYYSAPSDISNVVNCEGSDAIVTNIVVPADSRIKNKVVLRLGGDHPDIWTKVKDLAPSVSSFVDDTTDSDATQFEEEYYYPPPKAKYMEIIGNHAWYLNVTDRFNKRRPSRGYKSRAFAPFQVGDYDCFDIRPEDGTQLRGLKPWMGLLVVAKDHSIWTMDENFEEAPVLRTDVVGIVAPRTFCATPYGLIGLSHKGFIRGDVTNWDLMFGKPVQDKVNDYTTDQLEKAIGFFRDDYYFAFFGGSYNNIGVACYLPTGQWTRLSNIDCRSLFLLEGSGEGNRILYGDSLGYVNYMLYGSDDFGSPVESELRTMSFLIDSLDRSMLMKQVVLLCRHIEGGNATVGGAIVGEAIVGEAIVGSAGGSGSGYSTVTVIPYCSDVAKDSLGSNTISSSVLSEYYWKCPQGVESELLSLRVTGYGRYVITDGLIEVLKRPLRR